MTVYVDGDINVNIYMDLNGRWVSGDQGSPISWEYDVIGLEHSKQKQALQRWQIRRQNELLLSEIGDRAEWGTLHITGPAVRVSPVLVLIQSEIDHFAGCPIPVG